MINTMEKIDKRKKYDDKMKSLGFKKIHPYVHEDDRQSVLEHTSKLMKERLELLDKSR